MLIKFEEINKVLTENSIKISGAFHVGAHDCEEIGFYNNLGINDSDVIWIDAIKEKVDSAIARGIPNVYNAIITDKDDEEVTFNVSNNVQSSSVLALETHAVEHPDVFYVDKFQSKSITINSFFERNNIDSSKYNFWNFDIQGAELMALKGASNHIKNAKVIYLEVNEKELYKNCGLIDEVDKLLESFGFSRILTKMTSHGWGDALYILI